MHIIVQTMHQNWKENGFWIFEYIIVIICLSSICYNLFRASQKWCRASQNHKQLSRRGKLVMKIMLVPVESALAYPIHACSSGSKK